MDSGFWLVTRCEPRTVVSAWRIASRVIRCCSRMRAAVRAPALGGDGDEQMLGADVVVLQPLGFLLGGVGDGAQPRRQRDLRAAVRPRQPSELAAHGRGDRRRIGADLLDDRRNDALTLFDQRDEQVLRENLGVALPIGQLLRCDNRLLRLLGVLVHVHDGFFAHLQLPLPHSQSRVPAPLGVGVGSWSLRLCPASNAS